jgi:hypothetical protein
MSLTNSQTATGEIAEWHRKSLTMKVSTGFLEAVLLMLQFSNTEARTAVG